VRWPRAGRDAGVLGAAAVLFLCAALAAADPARAGRRDDPPDLQGPLSDFWPRVKRDWSRRITGLNRGPLQTAVWVALVWDGPDAAVLSVEDVAGMLQRREAMRWLRAQITRHRWSEISRRDLRRMQALRQNIILLGTPADVPLVERALEPTPLRVGPGWVSLDGRRVTGQGLLVLAITPNPIDPRYYALVITGTSAEAVAQAVDAPFGGGDYLVLQGPRLLEQGSFHWKDGRPDRATLRDTRSFTPHSAWRTRETAGWRLHVPPGVSRDALLDRTARDLETARREAAAFFGLSGAASLAWDVYVYPSLEEKLAQTADNRLAHLETATGALHIVAAADAAEIPSGARSLVARRLLQQSVGTWGAQADRELPGLAAAAGLAWLERFETIPLADWAARSTRDPGEVPIDLLLARAPGDPGQGDLSILDAAAFVRWLAITSGVAPLARWYREGRRASLHESFRDSFGMSLRQAESAWLDEIRPRRAAAGPPAGTARGRDGGRGIDPSGEGGDKADALARQAQEAFRAGRFEESARLAGEALDAAGAPEDRAWAQVTLGRAHARLGRPAAAAAALRSPEIRQGPEVVRVLADYWLEILHRPLNGRAARDVLVRDAEIDLMKFDWERAEQSLLAALALDPRSREAHALLGQVYLSRFQYWYDWALLDRELFPGVSQADPWMYQYLADKGREELQRAEALPPERAGMPWLPAGEPSGVQPGEASSHFLTGKAHFLRGDLEAARREMETVLELDRGRGALPAYARLYLARAAEARGDLAEARLQLEAIVKMAPSGQVTRLAREALRRLPVPDRSAR
jgi:tetratricopeptide (TPR) repeat protein